MGQQLAASALAPAPIRARWWQPPCWAKCAVRVHPKAKVLGRHGGVRWLGVAVGEDASSRPPHFECSVFEHSSMNLMAIEWASLPVCCLSSVVRPSATTPRQQPLNDYENSWQPARNDLTETAAPLMVCVCVCVSGLQLGSCHRSRPNNFQVFFSTQDTT